MTPEKILEIARRYGSVERKWVPVFEDDKQIGISKRECVWEISQDNLIAFAQSVLEEERGSSGVGKKLSAYKTLVESLEARIASHEKTRLSYQEARDTLESERECNARLTEELAERESSDEPVAWMDASGRIKGVPANIGSNECVPLYRRPPRARKLTDEEIGEIVREASNGSALRRDGSTSLRIARAIERRINGEEE